MRHRTGDSGQSLVELAMALPILALFLMGIIDFGRIVSTHFVVAQAARDAARYASVGGTDAQVQQAVQSDTGALGTGATWTVSPTDVRLSGTTVTVSVTDTVQLFDPLLAAVLGSQYTVQSSVSMRVE